MKIRFVNAAAFAAGLALASCASDPGALVQTNERARASVMRAIASDSALAARMADTLLLEPRTRDMLVEKVATHGEAMQTMMARIARDPVAIDGIIGFAMQESTMKAHLLTLMKGIEIGAASNRGAVEHSRTD